MFAELAYSAWYNRLFELKVSQAIQNTDYSRLNMHLLKMKFKQANLCCINQTKLVLIPSNELIFLILFHYSECWLWPPLSEWCQSWPGGWGHPGPGDLIHLPPPGNDDDDDGDDDDDDDDDGDNDLLPPLGHWHQDPQWRLEPVTADRWKFT